MSDPASYCSSTPRIQLPAVARWHTPLHSLATAIREISGLTLSPQRVERGFLTGYGDREIEDSISLTEFAKAIRRVYSVRCDMRYGMLEKDLTSNLN